MSRMNETEEDVIEPREVIQYRLLNYLIEAHESQLISANVAILNEIAEADWAVVRDALNDLFLSGDIVLSKDGQPYRVEAVVSDVAGGVQLSAKAWPAGAPSPSSWELTVTDTASNRLTSGSVGVRFSTYAGPAAATADDFTVVA